MKTILDAIGQAFAMFAKMAVEIITLPCELLNISDYWAIAYTTVIAGVLMLFGKKKHR